MYVFLICPKTQLVAYLEKTDGNTEFHEIISFLTRSSIHYALTVSPVVSTTFVEQFWMFAKSKIINNDRYITAKVAGKPVSILEASIRSDLLFDDADGIDSLPNQAIFDAIQLMGFISVFLDTQLKNVPVPLDHFPINALTSKVFSFMVKKGKHFSGNVTPLFDSMLVQPTEDEGDTLERQSEPQPIPSPPHLSEDQHETQTDPSPRPSPTTHIPDSILEGSGGNHGSISIGSSNEQPSESPYFLFSLSKRLKADSTIRVNRTSTLTSWIVPWVDLSPLALLVGSMGIMEIEYLTFHPYNLILKSFQVLEIIAAERNGTAIVIIQGNGNLLKNKAVYVYYAVVDSHPKVSEHNFQTWAMFILALFV
ncbi:hypothetical protein Tco_0216351 [Tanacetum coccineum]